MTDPDYFAWRRFENVIGDEVERLCRENCDCLVTTPCRARNHPERRRDAIIRLVNGRTHFNDLW